jgi:nucleotide-binding universal stress UspA family protein
MGSFPVLVVPSDGSEPGGRTPMHGPVGSIVVAVDPDAKADDRAIAHGVLWAQLWSARLVLARAVVALPLPTAGLEISGPIAPMPPVVPDLHAMAEQELAVIRDALHREGVDAHTAVIDGDGAGEALLEHVESTAADLLVVGRHPKGFWDRLFEGSESSWLVKRIRTAGLLVCHEEAR